MPNNEVKQKIADKLSLRRMRKRFRSKVKKQLARAGYKGNSFQNQYITNRIVAKMIQARKRGREGTE